MHLFHAILVFVSLWFCNIAAADVVILEPGSHSLPAIPAKSRTKNTPQGAKRR